MAARLVMDEGRYALLADEHGHWREIAALHGGASALLPPTRRVDESRLETAIETFFLRLTDAATGRRPSPALDGRQLFIADIVLLRELAHHAQLLTIHRA